MVLEQVHAIAHVNDRRADVSQELELSRMSDHPSKQPSRKGTRTLATVRRDAAKAVSAPMLDVDPRGSSFSGNCF